MLHDQIRAEEQAAERIAQAAEDRFVRLVLITPDGSGKHRCYFADSAGVVRGVIVPTTSLEKPGLFKTVLASKMSYFARHMTEVMPGSQVTPAWRSEVAAAMAAGDRFTAEFESAS